MLARLLALTNEEASSPHAPFYIPSPIQQVVYSQMNGLNAKEISAGTKDSSWPIYLKKASYQKFLNNSCKSLVDLGIGSGYQTLWFQDLGWRVTGYDYSTVLLKHYQVTSVHLKFADLNQIDPASNSRLIYQDALLDDIKEPTNIISIHTLQYLDKTALCLLLTAILSAPQNSIYFFVNHVYSLAKDEGVPNHGVAYLPRNYLLSFFSPRVDIEILHKENTPFKRDEGINGTRTAVEVVALRKC